VCKDLTPAQDREKKIDTSVRPKEYPFRNTSAGLK
jgi:hypothetical protein